MSLWQVRLSISLRHRVTYGLAPVGCESFVLLRDKRGSRQRGLEVREKLRERDVGWCKSPGRERWAGPAKQLFGMHAVMPVLYRSWHPGQRNYDERWLYHDCNCKCKSCSVATLFLCITMSCPNKKFTFHFISCRDCITLTNNNHWQMNNIKGDD